MSLYSTAVKRPVATFMAFVAIFVLGIFSLVQLPIDLFPEINPPNVTVITSYPGAGALEVEQNVTNEIEDQLSGISNLNEITSTSVDNISIINLQFSWDANLDAVVNEVRDVIGRIQVLLPEETETPIIYRFSADMFPVVILAATAEESFPNLRQILDDEVVSTLNRINGVGNVTLQGGPVREIQVLIDPVRLEAYNLDVMQISQLLAAENITFPAGDIRLGQMEYNVRIDTEFEDLEDIRNIVISNEGNQPIFLRNVAQVLDTIQELTRIERINGRNGATIVVQKQSDANTVQVARNVINLLPILQEQLPADVQLSMIVDTSSFITNSIGNLQQVLIYAIVFVVLVALFFLKKWRSTLIVGLAIPFSLVGAFIYLAITGNSLNLISLTSLSIALGMVVDDAIVVFENIMKNMEKGSWSKEAAIYGTNEVGNAVVATTLTVIAVFLPLTFLSGMTGIWFGQLGYIVVVTVSLSTLAALTLIPMLASVLFKKSGKEQEKKSGLLQKITRKRYAFSEKVLTALDNGYERSILWSLKHKAIVIIAAAIIFVGSLFLLPAIGTEFMPAQDSGQITMTVELAPGRNILAAERVIERIEKIFTEHVPEMITMTAGAGTTAAGQASFGAGAAGGHIIDITVRLVPIDERERDVFEIADMLRSHLLDIPEVIDFSITTRGGGGQQTDPIAINVTGNDLLVMRNVADQIAQRLNQIPGTRDVSVGQENERPTVNINFDREILASFGLNASQVAQNVRSLVAGVTATRFREMGHEYDVVLRYDPIFRQSIEDIENIGIPTPFGERVRLSQLGDIREEFSPPRIEHIDRERAIAVTSAVFNVSIGEVMGEIIPYIQEMEVPQGINIQYGGEFEEQQDAFADLFLILALSVLLVYIVMAAQFESYKYPFVIMFAIPFAFTGVLLALFITGTNLSIISFLGGIILTGIVVKNAIVLVDYINLTRARGENLQQAIVNSGRSRLRPVLMTTLTTIFAMLPLALSSGEGAEIWRPMAISVIGGLLFSTLVTLMFVPTLYAVVERKRG
jgi:hydrophobic/amphiphilic exporter-1 (mainly G- bacteria), HAE1 family